MLKTPAEIAAALTEYLPDQDAVIRQMAAERMLDPDQLTVDQYRRLITEEAGYSLETTLRVTDLEELRSAAEYTVDLLKIVEKIA